MNLNLDIPTNVTVIGIKINLTCNICRSSWGLFLREGQLPPRACECRHCATNNTPLPASIFERSIQTEGEL